MQLIKTKHAAASNLQTLSKATRSELNWSTTIQINGPLTDIYSTLLQIAYWCFARHNATPCVRSCKL